MVIPKPINQIYMVKKGVKWALKAKYFAIRKGGPSICFKYCVQQIGRFLKSFIGSEASEKNARLFHQNWSLSAMVHNLWYQ